MMRKNIFVNATAATEGGILTILNQFLDSVGEYNVDNHNYYVFITLDFETDDDNVKIINDVKGKKMFDRIKWDMYGMKKWSQINRVTPDLIISLQNTGVRFNKVPQLVYVHQSLPYATESKWNLIKKDERKYWFYRYVFKQWIKLTVKGKSKIIVQTKWMKNALIKNSFDEKDILIALPNVNNIEIKKVKHVNEKKQYLFYPAADYKYKNHDILIAAVKEITAFSDLDFKIILTLSSNSTIARKVQNQGLSKYFKFIGKISYDEVLSWYKGSHAILFPSYIETVGLPLIEGSTFGKKILVANCMYSREILNSYKLATFISHDDVSAWAEEIINSLSQYREEVYKYQSETGWVDVFNLIHQYV